MKDRLTRFAGIVGLTCVSIFTPGCKSNATTPTSPTPTEVMEEFTGTVAPLGSDSHSFTVTYTGASDAAITVNKLTTVANGTSQAITIGVGFGTPSLGVCTLAITNPTAALNTPLPTSGTPFTIGTYCVEIFDNTSAPTVTEPLRYDITVGHY